jgi:hypothetical protein
MVESNEIPVTKEELLAVVQQDESAMRYYAQNPWLIEPSGKNAPAAKKGRKPKNFTQPKTDAPLKPSSSTPESGKPKAKVSTPPKPIETTTKPPRLTAEELRDLTRREEENQRRPPEKKTEPKPPVFRGTPPPPKGSTEEELEAWRTKKKQELAEFIAQALNLGWAIPANWDGYGSAAKVAKWIGSAK